MAILPSPLGSNAKPMRGAGLKRCPFRQPAFEEEPTDADGNADPGTYGKLPPGPPHCTKPSSGLAVPAPFWAREPSALNVGTLAGLKLAGSRLNACLKRSR